MSAGHVIIVGTRGIPAQHGGFETFAERLALYLRDRGWKVAVTCQVRAPGEAEADEWRGVGRITIPVRRSGALGTVQFDWKSTLVALRSDAVVLVLGYNTAVFSLLYKLRGIPNVINMDGIEWRRAKWKIRHKVWLYINERLAGAFASQLVADHPEIQKHLSRGLLGRRSIAVIPYGTDIIPEASVDKPATTLEMLSLRPRGYSLVVARPEPENQILEIVRAFSGRRRGSKLVVLGAFDVAGSKYHRSVVEAASEEVMFPGAIYHSRSVRELRVNSIMYLHGHTVGGTNPSLVEALGAGEAVLAHDNAFNRWVAQGAARYFSSEKECDQLITKLLGSSDELARMRRASRARARSFEWGRILARYENLLALEFDRYRTKLMS